MKEPSFFGVARLQKNSRPSWDCSRAETHTSRCRLESRTRWCIHGLGEQLKPTGLLVITDTISPNRQGGSSLRRSRLKLFCSICTTIQRLHRIWDRPQIHGSKFKPDPSGDGGQASVICITHRVFLLRIRKAPFNGLISLCINLLAQVGLSVPVHPNLQ